MREPATTTEARDDDDAETGNEDGSMRTKEDRDDGLAMVKSPTDKGTKKEEGELK
jgi:hypothetical protein